VDAPLAVAVGLQKSGAVAVALLAATALLSRTPRVRALAMLGALILTPVLLISQVYNTDQFAFARHHPSLAIAGGVVAVAGLCVAAALLRRWPDAFPVIAVFALPFRIPIAVGGSTANLLVPLYLVVGAGVLAYIWPTLVAMRRRDPEVGDEDPPGPGRALMLALAAYVVLYGLQTLYSKDVTKGEDNLVFFYVPFALLFVLLRGREWSRRTLTACFAVLVALALVFVGIGFVEYHTRTLLLNPKVIDANQFATYFRVNSLFFDPNIYGRFLALVMLLITAVLIWTPRQREAVAGVVVLAVLWGGLVLTFSQSSFAALLLGLALLAALRWSVRVTLVAVVVALAVGGGYAAVRGHSLHISLSSSSKANSTTNGRFALIKGGLKLYGKRPIFGWGSGSFSRVYRRERKASSERATSASHTIPITVAAEQGVPGFVAYVAILVTAFLLLFRRTRGDPLRAALATLFAALVLHTMTYADFLEDPVTWALLGAGVALAARRADGDPPPRGPDPVAVAA
jgi:O-antigen ligase